MNFKDIVKRLLSLASGIFSGHVLVSFIKIILEKDTTFNSGDPFVIILLPFFLFFIIMILAIAAIAGYVCLLSITYTIHPPWATKLLNATFGEDKNV